LILVVDDDVDLRSIVREALEREGFTVDEAGDGGLALAKIEALAPELVVLDLHMPALGGLDVLRALGTDHPTPVIVLSGLDHEADRVIGLELGADDYVVKPFSPKELVARVRAVLRRARPEPAPRVLSQNAVTLDPARHLVTLHGRRLELTPKEFDLLQALLEAAGRVLSREHLLSRVWGYARADEIESRTVDVHVRRLRAKLGDAGTLITTVKSVGYRFEAD